MKTNMNKWMKPILFFCGIGISLVFIVVLALYIWIDLSVQDNIAFAKKKYPGKAEDALIAFLLDENNSPESKTHLAIYTLGQINSKKALPILYCLYKNDPEGKTCKGRHDKVICQYGLHTAIECIENDFGFLHGRLNR
jgi:hypothetical protein